MPNEVGPHVGVGVLEAVAHTGLRTEVYNPVDIDAAGEVVKRLVVREIDLLEPEAIAELLLKVSEPRPLQRRVVIIVEIVDADDLPAALEQRARRCRADEPRSPRDQNSHGRCIGGAAESA